MGVGEEEAADTNEAAVGLRMGHFFSLWIGRCWLVVFERVTVEREREEEAWVSGRSLCWWWIGMAFLAKGSMSTKVMIVYGSKGNYTGRALFYLCPSQAMPMYRRKKGQKLHSVIPPQKTVAFHDLEI